MKASVTFDTARAIRQIRFYQVSKLKEIRNEIMLTSFEIVTGAKAKITSDGHVDTGRLRSSIDILRIRNDGLGTTIGSDVHYASKIEKMDSYLFYSFEQNRPVFINRLVKLLRK